MALLPDPTTAASERSSVKNRLIGSRRRGSEFKRQAQGAGASRAGAGPEPRPACRVVQAITPKTRKGLGWGGVQGGPGSPELSGGGSRHLGGKTAGGSSRPNGSGFPLSIKCWRGG